MEKKLRIRFCLIVQLIAMLMLAVPVEAQKRDLHELFQQGTAKGVQATPNATDIIEVDLSEWESDYDTPIVVATGLKYRFTNGVVRKKNDGSWQGGPLFEIAKGSNVYLSSGASFDGGGFHTNDDVVLIKDGAFCLEGGSVTGVYGWENPTVNSNGDTAVRLQDVENPVISPCLVVLSGTIAGRVDNNTTTGIVSLSGGVITRLSTARDILMYGNAQILTNLYFYDQTAKVHLRSPLQYNLRFSNYKKDQMVVSPADYNVTESDLSKMSLGGSNASQYILSLENACIYVREQGPKRNIDDLEPGTLPDRITDPDNVEELTITGKLNGTDIKLIRSMANTNLKKLDISGCSIVSGGEEYLENYTPSASPKSVDSTYSDGFLPVLRIVRYYTKNDTIGIYMFAGLSKLENLILPNSVITVLMGAFMDSPQLSSITFGSSLNKFTTGFQFYGSNNIAEIRFNDNINFSSSRLMSNSGVTSSSIYDSKLKTLIAVTPSYPITYSILNTVDSIAPYAFAGCMNLKNVEIPSKLTHISDYAFCQSGLQSIVIPSTVTLIGHGAFFYCENLSSVTFSENIESIGYGAFAHCALTEADLSMTKVTQLNGDEHSYPIATPDMTYTYHTGVFEGTGTLTTVKLPATLQSLGGKVFTSSVLKDIYSNAITPPSLYYKYQYVPAAHQLGGRGWAASDTFYDVDTLTCRLHIPRGTLSAYRAIKGWNAFLNIDQDLPNDNFDPNYITDAEWLQQRLDEIAEEHPSKPVTLTIQDEGVTLSRYYLDFKKGCNVILTGGKLTVNSANFESDFVFLIYGKATFQNITLDFGGYTKTGFVNWGHLTIGSDVVYKNVNSAGLYSYFYQNRGELNIYSGDVEIPGTVIENEGTVNIRGDVKLRTTGQYPVYSYDKYVNGGKDVLYMYAGTLSSEGDVVMSATEIIMWGGTILGGDNSTLIDAEKISMYGGTLQGGNNSTLISERTESKIAHYWWGDAESKLIGGRMYGNGRIVGDLEFELASKRIDVTRTVKLFLTAQLPEIYLWSDATIDSLETFDSGVIPTINGDWEEMELGHVLIRNLEKNEYDKIVFVNLPENIEAYYNETEKTVILREKKDPNHITDAEWLQQRLDEIAAQAPKDPVTLTIQDEGVVLYSTLTFRTGCNVILTGGKLTVNSAKFNGDFAFDIDEGANATFQNITIDIAQWHKSRFINSGTLTIGSDVVYQNVEGSNFYYNKGEFTIYSGDVEIAGTVIENEGTVNIRGDVKFRTTGQNPVYSNNKYINGGNDVLYMYAGTLSSEGNVVMSATKIHMRGGTIMGGDNCTLIDATTFWIYSEDKINIPTLQGGENSTLIAERTKCYISDGNLIGGRTYGNGRIGRDGEPEGYPTFTLTSNRIDVTTEAEIWWWYGQLPEIYMGKDAVLSNVLLPNHITINGDWRNMANGHVLIKGIEKNHFDRINFIGFPYSDGRWYVEFDAANKQAKLHKMTLQEWLEEQNKGDEDKGTEDDPVAIDFPDYDNENGDLWEGDDMGFGTPDGHIKVHYWWRDLDWIIGYDGWPTRPSLRLMTNIWIYRGSSLRWSHFYLSGQNSSKYVYVYGTLIIDIDVFIRFFNYRFIHVMPGGRVIIRGGRMHTVGHLIYNEGGTVTYEDGEGQYTGQDYGIVNTESGTISISGGTVSGGVYNRGKGTISINGGFVSHGKGVAVGNSGGGRINISGGTICGYYPRTGVGGYNTPDIDNVNGTLWITGGTIGAKGDGIIRTYGDLWIDGKARFGEVWMHRNARIHIISKLTVLLRFHFFIVGEFDVDVPIFIGSEGYRLTEEDLKLIDVDLPEGYRLKLVDGNIIITNKGWLPDLFKFPLPDGEDPNKGKDPNDPYNPETPNGVDIDEDYTLPDLHILFGSADGSKKSGPMVIENATLRINSASTTFSHIEVQGEGDAHIETQGKMVIGEGTMVSGFQCFAQVLQGGSLIWQGGVTSDVAEVIDNDGGTVELKSGKIDGRVRSNTDITANGSVEVEEFVMTSGRSINVTGKLTTKWDVRIVTESGDDISAETVEENKAVLKSTDGYTLTEEDMEHITVNLPEDYVLDYNATEKAVYIKKASEVGVRQVRDASCDGTFSIYSASGSLQKQNATTTDGLAKGMYIVNGKKVVVK